MPAGGRSERPGKKSGNCAPKPHAARRVYLEEDVLRKAFPLFFPSLAGIAKASAAHSCENPLVVVDVRKNRKRPRQTVYLGEVTP
ncbi:hypothetical protein EDM56_18260 [Brevibacillus fluminis]|uniref:Uncharacterized protein n=1 Tax=Brevibacillus fluminis TaxID=511487 RepID=A0A3M8DEE2_9BACL|nr:hypothetical protein EDM56_18260 [Brevibacillus fluminis]